MPNVERLMIPRQPARRSDLDPLPGPFSRSVAAALLCAGPSEGRRAGRKAWPTFARRALFVSLTACVLGLFGPGVPKASLRAPIRVSYLPPKNPAHEPIFRTLRDRRALERVRDGLARLALPKTLTIKTEGCDGDVNAAYDAEDRSISICYEYLAYIQDLSKAIPPAAAAEGLTPANYVVGPFLEVVLHELAHALFDMKRVPILGREEDAADQVASYILLRLGKDEARRTIVSIAAMYASEAREAPPKLKDFADEHGLPAQRFYNLLCLGYGKDRRKFGDLVDKGFLPSERAEQCEDEYRQVDHAVRRLIWPAPADARRSATSRKHGATRSQVLSIRRLALDG
jgi:hypothetical protein